MQMMSIIPESADDFTHPVLLHVIEAARVLALSRARVYQLIAAGELPHIRIGKSVRVPRAALLRYIERRIVNNDDNEAA